MQRPQDLTIWYCICSETALVGEWACTCHDRRGRCWTLLRTENKMEEWSLPEWQALCAWPKCRV